MKKSTKKSFTKKKDQNVFLMESVVLNSTKLKIPHTVVAAFLMIKVSQIAVSAINIGVLLILTALFMHFLVGSGLLSLGNPFMSQLVYSPSLPLWYPRVGFPVFVGFPIFPILRGSLCSDCFSGIGLFDGIVLFSGTNFSGVLVLVSCS